MVVGKSSLGSRIAQTDQRALQQASCLDEVALCPVLGSLLLDLWLWSVAGTWTKCNIFGIWQALAKRFTYYAFEAIVLALANAAAPLHAANFSSFRRWHPHGKETRKILHMQSIV